LYRILAGEKLLSQEKRQMPNARKRFSQKLQNNETEVPFLTEMEKLHVMKRNELMAVYTVKNWFDRHKWIASEVLPASQLTSKWKET